MTLLYRSPNLRIDDHEWHVTVDQSGDRRSVNYRFRRVGARIKWQNITKWEGRPPKSLREFFEPYQKSIRVAMGTSQHARHARHLQVIGVAA